MQLSLPSHGINFYKSLHKKARNQLALERARHQEQTKFLKERWQQKCEEQYEQLAKRLKYAYDSKFAELKDEYAPKKRRMK